MKPIVLMLTCGSPEEAQKISKTLLEQKLVACVKSLPMTSAAWWKGKLENTAEVLLIMDSVEEKFDAIDTVVNELHSYETPNLTSIAVHQTTNEVQKWLEESLRDETQN